MIGSPEREDERVLVLAPTARDGEMSRNILSTRFPDMKACAQ